MNALRLLQGKVNNSLFYFYYHSAISIWIRTIELKISGWLSYSLATAVQCECNHFCFHYFLLVNAPTECSITAEQCECTFFCFCNFLLMPLTLGFKPLNIGSLVNCHNKCSTAAGQCEWNIFLFYPIFS